MADLYQSPTEARRELNERVETGNFLPDFITDRIREGLVYDPEEGKYKKTGAAFWLQGLGTHEGYDAIKKGKDAIREAQEIKRVLDANPAITEERLRAELKGEKLTSKNARSIVGAALRTRELEPKPLTKFEEAQISSDKSTNERLLAGQQQQYELSLQQMINNNDAAAAELRYQMLRDRKEDRMYNERMEKLDRKDRISALQNVAGGLAALGAAFAI